MRTGAIVVKETLERCRRMPTETPDRGADVVPRGAPTIDWRPLVRLTRRWLSLLDSSAEWGAPAKQHRLDGSERADYPSIE